VIEFYLVAQLMAAQAGDPVELQMGPFPSEQTCMMMLRSEVPHKLIDPPPLKWSDLRYVF
jgi:hypothetical protein